MSGATLRKVVAVTALLVACSSDSSGPPATVASVVVSAPGSTVPITGALQLSAVPRDAGGNVLSDRPVTWSSGDTAVARVSTSGLVTGRALGTVTITATVEGIPGSLGITVVTGPPARLSFLVQPLSTTSGTAISPAVQVEVQDAAGNRVTGASTSITLTLGANPKNGSLVGTTVQAATNGVATFNGLSIDSAATGYTLAAAATGLTGATSGTFNITVGAAATLGFLAQPTSTTGGATLNPAVQVEVRDAGGNRVTTASNSITVAIGTNANSGTLGGNKTIAAVNGVANFSTLTIDSAGTGYTLSAAASGLTGGTSSTFDITVGPAVKLGFLVQPTNTPSNQPVTPAVQVEVRDLGGNRVTTATTSITLAIGTNPSGGVLTGTIPKAAVNGVATFSDLRIDKNGTGYTLIATGGSLTGATSTSFDIALGGATKLVFVNQPGNATGGATISPVTVAVQDAGGNVVTTDTRSVTVAIGTNPNSGTLSGMKTVAAVNGIATFSTLSVDSAGTGYTLTAAATGLTGAASNAFNITVGTAAKLGFRVQPASTTGGAVISPAVEVEVRDAGGNRVTTATANVTLAITSGTGKTGAHLSGGTSVTVAANNGVATFNALSVDSAGTGYTLTATAGSLTAATSSAFSITVGSAAKLAFGQPPTSTTGGATIAPAVTVRILDAGGNLTTSTANVTLAITSGTGKTGAHLSGGTSVTVAANNGVATFNSLSVDSAGTGYTLTATSGSLTAATSSAFSISVGSATNLTFGQQPTSTTGGATITPAVTVRILDNGGNLTGSTANVTLAITSGTGTTGAHLSGGASVTIAAVGGIATFGTLSIDSVGANYTLRATSGTLSAATSNPFSISVGSAAKLAFLVQPSSTASGASIAPAVQVEVRDAGGNRVATTMNITLAIGTNPSGGILSGGGPIAAVGGVASFANLSIDKSGTGYTLTAAGGALTGATSTTFNITGGTPDHLGFFVQPSNDTAGSLISPAVQVEILDAAGNRVTSDNRSITVAIFDNPGGGSLSGGATALAANGVATFSSLSIDKAGTGYTLQATSSPALTSATSVDFNIVPAAPKRTHFFVEPSSATAGVAITPDIQVEILDSLGNRVGTATNSVTVALLANPGGGTLSGPKSHNASAGVATFPGLSINKAAIGYTIRATSSGLASDTSVAFNITPGPATQLAFTSQPASTAAGWTMAAVVVTARDAQGNTATGFTGDVTMAIGANPGSGTLSGTLSVPAASGVATFSTLSIDKTGSGYTLTAASSGLTGATSNTFNITVGAAAKLAFDQQPTPTTGGATISPAVTVRILDANGNLTSSTASVSLAITTGTGTAGAHLGGTASKAAVAGVATFNDLGIDSAGTAYTLTATSSGLVADTSNAFNIAVGAPAKLSYLVQPSTTPPGATISPAVQVEIRDLGGNRVTTATNSVTLTIGTNPGGGALSGGGPIAAVNGVATFPSLSIDNAGNGYDLTASATSLTGATSNSFDIVVGTAAKLAFIVPPSNAAGGATISPAVQVQIQDASGNPVTTATNSVTLAIGTNPKSGSHLSGTLTRAAVAGTGVATFNNLSIDSAAIGYTLSASSSGLTGVTSNTFSITVGPASKLGFRVQPSNTTGGVSITPAVQVEVRDAGGNRVTTAGNSIIMAIGTNPSNGTLSGTTTLSASSGLATFSTLSIDSAGTGYRLSATASGLSGATSSTFDITVGAPAKLGFLVQPSNAAAGSFITPAVKVEILDAGGNLTTATSTVTVAIGTNPGGGTLSGTKSIAAVSGVATFSNLSIDKKGSGYTLQATSSPVPAATSSPFVISADGVSASLSSLSAPTDTIGQCSFSCVPGIHASAVTVTVKDQFGNLVDGAPVTLAASGSGNGFTPFATGTTDANGVFTAAFNSSVFEAKTVSATAGGVGIAQTAAVAVMPVLVGAGDIADCNSVRDDATANQLDSIPGTVFAAGDNAYPNGRAADFSNCYDPTWGRQKARTKPVVGNHEYDSSGTAAAYFNYFTPAVADPLSNGFGYYSFELGTWHVVVLNSDSGATSPSSAQLTWLQSDLVGRSNQCVLALWHRPLFTSGSSGGAGIRVRRLWQALEDAGAEIVVNGHDHLYERFAPQDSLGIATSAGIREFIVGTGGGETHGNFSNPLAANDEANDGPTSATYSRGVLRLILYANSYRWEFLHAQGQGTYTDSGTQACH